jgi:hypothetical protein
VTGVQTCALPIYEPSDLGYRLRVRKNKSGSSIRELANPSYKDEDEVLVPRGVKYKILSISRDQGGSRPYTDIELEEI